MVIFEKKSRINCSAAELYRWHEKPDAFERLSPPWSGVKILKPLAALANGETTSFLVSAGILSVAWVARMEEVEPGHRFVDVQTRGPFAFWRHEHMFVEEGPKCCWMNDRVTYQLPMGILGRLFAGKVSRDIERLFAFRHDRLMAVFGEP